MNNEDQQFSLLHSIEVHEFLYQKEDIVRPHASLWGDFNFSLNGILEMEIEEQLYLSPPSYGLWIPLKLFISPPISTMKFIISVFDCTLAYALF